MNIYNVGSRIMNTYVYPIENGYVMIDTGYDTSFSKVCRKLKRLNISLNDIKYVFLTHAHDDHAGFLNTLLSKTSDLKVIVSSKSIPTLLNGKNSFNGGCSGLFSLVFCNIMKLIGRGKHEFPPVEKQYLNRFIKIDNDNKIALETILKGKILFTPGHTSDSISLMLSNGIIFSGDATMNGLPSINNITIWIENKKEYIQSWDTIISQKSHYIYPSHGKPFKDDILSKNISYVNKIKLYRLKE